MIIIICGNDATIDQSTNMADDISQKDLIVLYCIVLYLYIYIVHTNQKRFQCERPREKRAVLRERKEALGSLVNKVDRVEGRVG